MAASIAHFPEGNKIQPMIEREEYRSFFEGTSVDGPVKTQFWQSVG